jgi:hypothetical protein
LSVADNARDAVLLHVPASSERQECGKETGLMTQEKEYQNLKRSDICGSFACTFINTTSGKWNLTNL